MRDTVLGTATERNGPLSMPTDWWTTGQVGSAQARLVDRVPYRFAQRERERSSTVGPLVSTGPGRSHHLIMVCGCHQIIRPGATF
jgi:hypothetical protein